MSLGRTPLYRTVLASLLALGASACSPHTVEPGTVGVLVVWGELQAEAFAEGFYWESWFGERYYNYDARIQKVEAKASASSKDLQVVSTTVALNYRVKREDVVDIYRNIGPLTILTGNIIDPALQESIKRSTAKFTADELVTRREEVKLAISDHLGATLEKSGVEVTELSITNFKFDDQYQNAVEAKQVAEQKALTATNDLARIRVEAEQAKVRAQGTADSALIAARAEAESLQLLRQTLTPELLQLRAIEKWNGKLPHVSGGDGGGLILDISAVSQ